VSFKSFTEYLNEACNCWKGYKRVPGTKPCAQGSCVKEETAIEEGVKETPTGRVHTKDDWEGNPSTFKDKEQNKLGSATDRSRMNKAIPPNDKKEDLDEAAVDAKGYKSSTGGLTQKGRDAYNRSEGSHLKAPVTTPPSELKAGSKAANRRKSFCARMSGVDGPMKKPNGEPTRKALALRKWNC
jgi:hypothetical protein